MTMKYCAATAILYFCTTGIVIAQTPKDPSAGPAAGAAPETQMLPIKHTDATELSTLLANVYRDRQAKGQSIRFVPVPHTNSLLVAATSADLSGIKALIAALDQPTTRQETQRRLSILSLTSIEPDQPLVRALELTTGGDGSFTIDRARSSLILVADDATTKSVELLLTKLRSAATDSSTNDMLIRVVWLANGVKDLAAPPSDIGPMLPALAKMGIEDLRLVAQSIVKATPSAPFQLKGDMHFAVWPCKFEISGHLQDAKDRSVMDISVKATVDRTKGQTTLLENIIDLRTTVQAPAGHFVILGAVPAGNTTSVLILQLMNRDAR